MPESGLWLCHEITGCWFRADALRQPPKALPAPSPVSVESNDQLICVEKPSQNSASDDQ
jgi:hypothetical protein